MNKLIAILLLASPCLASGPKYIGANTDNLVSQEFSNVYQDIRSPSIGVGSASTMTITYLNVSSITLNGTSLVPVSPMPLNILDNGGFEIWQRGTSFSAPATGAYLADRWKVFTDEAANVTVTQETTTVSSGLDSMKVVVASAGASHYWMIRHFVENYADYRGKTLTVSIRIKTSTASTCRILIADGVSSALSSYHTGGGAFETLTATLAVSASATAIEIQAGMTDVGDKKNGTYYFDSAMLAVSPTAATFTPTNIQEDLARCQRFYWRLGGNITSEYLDSVIAYTTSNFLGVLQYPMRMRAIPTVTVANVTNLGIQADQTIGAIPVTSLSPNTVSPTSIAIQGNIGAASFTQGQAMIFYSGNTNAYVEFSADL